MSFKLILSEAAQFSAASVADYKADRIASNGAIVREERTRLAKRRQLTRDLITGAVVFVALFAAAYVAL